MTLLLGMHNLPIPIARIYYNIIFPWRRGHDQYYLSE